MVITVPAEAQVAEPTVVSVRGENAEGAAFGHTLIDVGVNARAAVVLDHAGSATYADNVEIVVGDGASLTVVSLQDWADDAVHLSHHHAMLGRDARLQHTAVTLGGGVVRLAPSVRYAGPGGDAELLGAVLRRRRTAPGAPAVRGSRAAELPQPGGLQRSTAGRRGAHRLDRRRADQGGGDRDRHLRAEPEPAADRGRPGRLGAEPGDPHRRGGRRRAREHQRAAGGPPPVLPDGPRHPAGRGPAAGDPRLLRRADQQDQHAWAAGPDRRVHRGRAGGGRWRTQA